MLLLVKLGNKMNRLCSMEQRLLRADSLSGCQEITCLIRNQELYYCVGDGPRRMGRDIMFTRYSTALYVFVRGRFSSLIPFSIFSISTTMLQTHSHLNAAFLRTSW